jgi:hypothetical protein
VKSLILPCPQDCVGKAAVLDFSKIALGLNSFVSAALKSKLELAAEFWSAKLLLNQRRASLQSKINFSRQLVTYLNVKGLAAEFNAVDGVKFTGKVLDGWKGGLKGWVLSIEKM